MRHDVVPNQAEGQNITIKPRKQTDFQPKGNNRIS
jgi:hypothetical protein